MVPPSELLAVIHLTLAVCVNSNVKFNDVDNRYLITEFDGRGFPSPVVAEICNPIDLTGVQYQTAQCLNQTHAQRKVYSNPDCSGIPSITEVYDAATYQTGLGSLYDFDCDPDGDDTYVEIEYRVGSCSNVDGIPVLAALNSCARHRYGLGTLFVRYYCNDQGYAEIQYFNISDGLDNCDDPQLFEIFEITDTCEYSDPFSSSAIYGIVK